MTCPAVREAAAQSATEAAQSAQEAASSANLADIQNKITNCITKIPQDIKLELSDGTLTLKAGSIVYRGNGQAITIAQDISMTYPANATILVCASVSAPSLQGRLIANCFSGNADPQTPNSIYYDTSANIVKFYPSSGGTGIEVSLPIAICTATGQITSIDQVFNGFGFIGKTIFALPGVEGLIPNGFNSDGTLNNIQAKSVSLKRMSDTQENRAESNLVFGPNGDLGIASALASGYTYYDPKKNLFFANTQDPGGNYFAPCTYSITNGQISLNPKQSLIPR